MKNNRSVAATLRALRPVIVYSNKPATICELRADIEREIAGISADLCKEWSKLGSTIGLRKRARGAHAKEIEFHT